MMTEDEHLLLKLAEECAEVTQEIMKALRFGPGHARPGHMETNLERIRAEVIDLRVTLELLEKNGLIPHRHDVPIAEYNLRRVKIAAAMDASRALGRLILKDG